MNGGVEVEDAAGALPTLELLEPRSREGVGELLEQTRGLLPHRVRMLRAHEHAPVGIPRPCRDHRREHSGRRRVLDVTAELLGESDELA